MLFKWFDNNRSFKKGSDIKGQIAPLLIVVLVILLIAAMATVNIGRVGIDKTYSANAADAGALTGASAMASIMNGLCASNKGLANYYAAFYEQYRVMQTEADGYYNTALNYMIAATALVAAATVILILCKSFALMKCCDSLTYKTTIWYWIVAALLAAAATFTYLALEELYSFITVVSAQKELVKNFHSDQWENYCDIRDSVNESHSTAVENVYKVTFGNSGISSKLSTDQQSSYSDWLDGNGPSSGSYSWNDKLDQSHSVKVSVNVPSVTTYEVQHTKNSYSEEMALLEEIIADATDVAETLYSCAITLTSTAASYLIMWAFGYVVAAAWRAFQNCKTWIDCAILGIIWFVVCLIWWTSELIVWGSVVWLGNLLMLVMAVEMGIGSGTIYGLKDGIDAAFEGIDPNGSQSSTSCSDVSDLLIVMFSAVPYPGDVSVTATQSHPGSSYGLYSTSYPTVSSWASGSYGGGDVGSYSDNYTPQLSGTD